MGQGRDSVNIDIEWMGVRLVEEILEHLHTSQINPTRISFVAHSLGNLIVRSALTHRDLARFLPRLHTLLSLAGPHLGVLYNQSGLVSAGLWFVLKVRRYESLLQLALKDHPDVRHTFVYELSSKPGLEYFRNVLLVGSSQDKYVPYHSTRIEMCKAAANDNSTQGEAYKEMLDNLLRPLVANSRTTNIVRYDAQHAAAVTNTNVSSLIGRQAHIAPLDSELFIEKFILVSALKYFI